MSIKFGNEQTTLFFDENCGYLEKIDFNGKSIELASKIWQIETTKGTLTIKNMESFSAKTRGDSFLMTWKNDIAKVIVTLAKDNVKIRWNISVELNEDNYVGDVHFPVFEGLNFDTDNYLIISWQNGRLLKNPVENFLSKGKDVPFWVGRGKYEYVNEYPAAISFQYSAFYSLEEGGYYFSTEDSEAYVKTYTYRYNEEKHAMDFLVTNYPENMYRTNSYSMSYDFVLLMFDGDWRKATEIYKEWAVKQKWVGKPLTERKLPQNLVDIDLWRINHRHMKYGTQIPEFFDTSVKIRDAIDCKLALHWYGWNLQYNGCYETPDLFSKDVRDIGWGDKLKEWNKRFDDEGILKIPYTDPRLWATNSWSWDAENAVSAAVKLRDGSPADEPWFTNYFRVKTMCPACAKVQNKMVDMCEEYVLDMGFDGVYLDQIASYNAMLCFDEKHPHPYGGGTWWNNYNNVMVENIRKILGSESILTTESCCETYINVFDLFLILDMNFQEIAFNALTEGDYEVALPLFNLIYGEYALTYGSICQFTDRIDHFEFNFVRNMLWGIIPCVEGGTDEELENASEQIKVTKKVVDFYKENKEYFLYGHLAEIPDYSCATKEMDWVAVDDDGNSFPYVNTYQVICATVWDTLDGRKIFAYNYGDSEENFEIYGKSYAVPAKEFMIVSI